MSEAIQTSTSPERDTEYQEERLAGGTLRLTVVVPRSEMIKRALMQLGLGILASVACVAVWYFTGSLKAGVVGWVLGPPLILLGGFMLWRQFRGPSVQTHIIEANPGGLTIQSMIRGKPIHRYHPRSDLPRVEATGPALSVYTTGGGYSCLALVKAKHLKVIAEKVTRELNPGGDATQFESEKFNAQI
jgi:hypothetical protein